MRNFFTEGVFLLINVLSADLNFYNMIKLSLIIATYNRADNLLRTLQSLLPQILDRELWEVVVVNNNCADHTSQTCRDFALENPTLNFKMVIETAQGLRTRETAD